MLGEGWVPAFQRAFASLRGVSCPADNPFQTSGYSTMTESPDDDDDDDVRLPSDRAVGPLANCFVQNIRTNATFDEDPPRPRFGHNAATDACYNLAHEAEGLEPEIAEIERELERGE